jgi:translocation and assembly module TamB
LLFGRDATELSAAQSVQLAAAVARFTSSTVPDPLGWVRRTFRVDRVSVQSDEESPESTVVSVGKYVGRRVFVSFDQGTAEATSKARVEVELTRQLNVATEVGTDSESRLGLDWRYRY